MKLEINKWYYSKRGHLCRVDQILEKEVLVTSHYTGSNLIIPVEEANFFTDAPPPIIPPGTAMVKIPSKKIKSHHNTYTRYPHIIEGSIYTVKSTTTPKENIVKIDGKTKIKTTKSAKGSTRCKIKCQTPGCPNIRDVIIQCAAQVSYCVACKKAQKKEKFKEFLQKRTKS